MPRLLALSLALLLPGLLLADDAKPPANLLEDLSAIDEHLPEGCKMRELDDSARKMGILANPQLTTQREFIDKVCARMLSGLEGVSSADVKQVLFGAIMGPGEMGIIVLRLEDAAKVALIRKKMSAMATQRGADRMACLGTPTTVVMLWNDRAKPESWKALSAWVKGVVAKHQPEGGDAPEKKDSDAPEKGDAPEPKGDAPAK